MLFIGVIHLDGRIEVIHFFLRTLSFSFQLNELLPQLPVFIDSSIYGSAHVYGDVHPPGVCVVISSLHV